MKLRLNFQLAVSISHVILSENLNETKKKSQYKNFKLILNFKCDFSQFYGPHFFQRLSNLKKAYVMICTFLMGYQVLQSVICKYN